MDSCSLLTACRSVCQHVGDDVQASAVRLSMACCFECVIKQCTLLTATPHSIHLQQTAFVVADDSGGVQRQRRIGRR